MNQSHSPYIDKRGKKLNYFVKNYGLAVTALLFFIALFFYPKPSLTLNNPLYLAFNQCDEDIRAIFYKEILAAKKSIDLSIYSLNDPKIVAALEQALERKVSIAIRTDPKNLYDLKKLRSFIYPDASSAKLMHQKILIIDEERVWIGSANFTKASLCSHDNGILGIWDRSVAQALLHKQGGEFVIQGQKLALFFLPQERHKAYSALKEELTKAKKSIQVAMYTWTHPELTDLIVQKKQEGLAISVVIDSASFSGSSKKAMEKLSAGGVALLVPTYSPMFHHKMAIIDNSTLILGSANWTKAAFKKNDECFLILYNLTEKQCAKIEVLWHILRAIGTA